MDEASVEEPYQTNKPLQAETSVLKHIDYMSICIGSYISNTNIKCSEMIIMCNTYHSILC